MGYVAWAAWLLLILRGRILGGVPVTWHAERLSANASTRGGHLPMTVIQVGPARSATTLQFQHACVAMHLAYAGLGTSKNHCKFVPKVPRSNMSKFTSDVAARRWKVIKTHREGWVKDF